MEDASLLPINYIRWLKTKPHIQIMKKILLTMMATCSLGQAATTVIQTFQNNSLGTITDGNSATLIATPNFSTTQVSGATELKIEFSFVGAAHMFIQSTTGLGRQHAAQLLTQVTFSQFDHLIEIDSLQLLSINENIVLNGNASGDTSEVFPDNPMSYTASWTTSDTATIMAINGSSLTFSALPLYALGFDSQVNQDFGGANYSNFRLEDSSFSTQFILTTVPEPSSSLLLGISTIALLCRRRR